MHKILVQTERLVHVAAIRLIIDIPEHLIAHKDLVAVENRFGILHTRIAKGLNVLFGVKSQDFNFSFEAKKESD